MPCAPAEAFRRGRPATPVVLAVAVVHRVLRHHQTCGEHEMVDGGRVRMAADHVPAHGEAVELLLPVLGIQRDLVQCPGLDPPADLLDQARVGLGHRVVVEARDRSPLRCGRRRGRRCLRLVPREQAQARRAQAAGATQEPLQPGARSRRPGCRGCGEGPRGESGRAGHGRGGQGGSAGRAAGHDLHIECVRRGGGEQVRPEAGSGLRQARPWWWQLRCGHPRLLGWGCGGVPWPSGVRATVP